MNVVEQLRAAFGESADKLDTSSLCGTDLGFECGPVELLLSDKSRLFVYCSGLVIAVVPTLSTGTKLRFYVIIDDSDGLNWDRYMSEYREGRVEFDSKRYHGGRPGTKLRVVASI